MQNLLDVNKGIEIRTFKLDGVAGLDRILRSAYFLGAALKAYQETCLGIKVRDQTHKNLAETWTGFSDSCRKIFKNHGLDDIPYQLWNPREKDPNKNPFILMADLLDEAAEDFKTRGGKFVSEVRKLVIETRAKVNNLIYPKEK